MVLDIIGVVTVVGLAWAAISVMVLVILDVLRCERSIEWDGDKIEIVSILWPLFVPAWIVGFFVLMAKLAIRGLKSIPRIPKISIPVKRWIRAFVDTNLEIMGMRKSGQE